ncbi:MAG: class I SAM-dependent RNA methyltransferase [Devosia nanyangense]|uniref:Class I SAM-dependent RNA methyltransferase n=1 Tax=Devosia nanyangense TaxID=1228055 RepID=A0A933L3J1_9HYPH|nr:class I SAM-dependent RNA methyltransferase [Devosia nanyangense]
MAERAPLPEPDTRAEPFCRYFGTCGGCTLQHFGPPSYMAYKQELVETALRSAHIVAEVAPLIEAHGDGRRRATLHARGAAVGYMKARSHDLLDIAACPILVPALEHRAPALGRPIAATIGDCDIAFTATDTGLDVAVHSDRKFKPEKLTLPAQRSQLARLSLNGEVVLEARAPAITMGRATVELPISSFLQATAMAEATLANLVLEGIGRAKSVADLFCGLGPFTLRIAEQARVFAADADKAAITALQNAVRHTQGLKPVTAMARDLFREPLVPFELTGYDAVVFDPPRAGAEAQARELARSKVRTVVAVSCEPRTFARDAAILVAGGYRLETVTPVDQFAWSTHVEVVGVFRR